MKEKYIKESISSLDIRSEVSISTLKYIYKHLMEDIDSLLELPPETQDSINTTALEILIFSIIRIIGGLSYTPQQKIELAKTWSEGLFTSAKTTFEHIAKMEKKENE
jgi:hypothetical protein